MHEAASFYLMPGAAHNRGEDSTWSIISCKASFAHSRAIVNNEGCNFIFHHLEIRKKKTVKPGSLVVDFTLDYAVVETPIQI